MTPYKIHIVQYASRMASTSQILLGDLHNDPMPMTYYVWAITNDEHTVVVDLGFTHEMAKKRKREMICNPTEGLAKVGIDADKVEHVIVTHLHWDHVGNYDRFPKAQFYVQESELAFCTGRHVKYPVFQQALEGEDIAAVVKLLYDGRVNLLEGSRQLLPGITVHKVGGHTAGMQIVEVETARGTAVIASDAAHFYRNMREMTPFPILHDVPGMLDGFMLMQRLAVSEDFILPGHDPEVLDRHPMVADGVALLE